MKGARSHLGPIIQLCRLFHQECFCFFEDEITRCDRAVCFHGSRAGYGGNKCKPKFSFWLMLFSQGLPALGHFGMLK